MNRAAQIIKVLNDADIRGDIAPRDKAQALVELAELLNCGMTATEIDLSQEMEWLWKRVNRKWERA